MAALDPSLIMLSFRLLIVVSLSSRHEVAGEEPIVSPSGRMEIFKDFHRLATPYNGSKTEIFLLRMHSRLDNVHHGLYRVPAIDFVREYINNRTDILANYHLTTTFKRTLFNQNHKIADSIRDFMDTIYLDGSDNDDSQCKADSNANSRRAFLMLLGPLYSSEAKVIAELAATFNLVELSDTASTPALSDKSKYPLFFRSAYASNGAVHPMLALLRQYNWTRITLMSEDHAANRDFIRGFHREATKEGFDIVLTTDFKALAPAGTQSDLIEHLQRNDVRIVVISSGGGRQSLKTLCDMSRAGVTSEKNIFIYRTVQPNWWMRDDLHNCTHQELFRLLAGSFMVMPMSFDRDTPGERFYTGTWTVDSAFDDLKRRGYDDYAVEEEVEPSGSVPHAMDGLWAVALALNRTDEVMRTQWSPPCDLTCFNYSNVKMTKLIQESLQAVNFIGFSGPFAFDDNQDRVGWWVVWQVPLEMGPAKQVAVYNYRTGQAKWHFDRIRFGTKDGKPPLDREPIEPEVRT